MPHHPSASLPLTGEDLDLASIQAVARRRRSVHLESNARARMARSRSWVRSTVEGGATLPVYGVNTGYGSLARVRIDNEHIAELSWNLIRSHAAGVGPDVDQDVVRTMMLLRANALAKGVSGVRPALVDTLTGMLNAGVTPVVPSRGSCGSSGDLAPLSHLGLVVYQGPHGSVEHESGEAWLGDERMSGAAAMERAGLERLVPAPKEGLGMINGAQLTCAYAALAVADAASLVLAGEIVAAMSIEALLGVTRAFHPGVHALRPYLGAREAAANLTALLAGSTLVDSVPDKVQDAYSLRCSPVIFGAVRDGVRFASQQVGVELNSVTDNPVILVDVEDENKAFSAGLFHGEPVGMAADHLKLCLCELGSVSERRVYRLTTSTLSARLPPLLAELQQPDLGMMMPQVSAASLVAQNRQLAWPNSADSIPTCEDQEDHVAMSTAAARRATEVLRNTEQIVAIELLAASKALWARQAAGEVVLGRGTGRALQAVEKALGGREPSEAPADDLAVLIELVRSGELVEAVSEDVALEGVLR